MRTFATQWIVALLVAALVIAGLALPLVSLADSAEPSGNRGYEIAARSDRSDRGFGDSRVTLEMILTNAAGRESRRRLSIATLEIPDEGVGLSLIHI